MSNDVVVSQLDARARTLKISIHPEDKDHVSDLIEKYKISYIYGALEEEKYLMVNHQLLRSLGQVVFENPNPDEYRTYIVKIY